MLQKFKIHLIDSFLLSVTGFFLVFAWLYIFMEYNSLPETITVHFDISGNPDGYNFKNNIWFGPTVFSVLILGCIFGFFFPDKVQFPKRTLSIKETKIASKKMLLSALLLAFLQLIIVHSIISSSLYNSNLGIWCFIIVAVSTAIYILLIIYYKNKITKS